MVGFCCLFGWRLLQLVHILLRTIAWIEPHHLIDYKSILGKFRNCWPMVSLVWSRQALMSRNYPLFAIRRTVSLLYKGTVTVSRLCRGTVIMADEGDNKLSLSHMGKPIIILVQWLIHSLRNFYSQRLITGSPQKDYTQYSRVAIVNTLWAWTYNCLRAFNSCC
mgnify:CR=1 FL=1